MNNINTWKSEDKYFFPPVVAHLKKRCAEDPGLLADSEGKTWENCQKYITEKARELLNGQNGRVPDETVYEWAEDYCRMTAEEYGKMYPDKPKAAPAAKKFDKDKAVKNATAKKPAQKKPAVKQDGNIIRFVSSDDDQITLW